MVIRAALFVGLLLAALPAAARAAELRVIDSVGLARGVRVVEDASSVTIVVENPREAGGECVLSNIDGLASERREKISPAGECVFRDIAAGTWQVAFPRSVKWKVK
jgi:hypothetical protein